MSREILFINDNMDAGGAEALMQNVSRYLAQRGENVTVWAANGSEKLLREKYPDGIKWRPWPFWNKSVKRFSPRHFIQKLVKILFERVVIKLKSWDIVVSFKEGESMVLASKLRAGRKVSLVQTDFGHYHWTGYCFADNEAERQCMAGFDKVAAVSASAAQGLIDAIGDPGNLCVLYNPINYTAVEQKARLVPPQRPEDKTLLVSVGRLNTVKRYDMLIDICKELSAEFPLELWIVGGGELEEQLREKLKREDISCVRLLGTQSNPYPYVACADWLVSASHTESYGLTVQEALILGVPVIACACPAIAENMDDSWGLLCGMEKAALKEAIHRALNEKELNRRCRENITQSYAKQSLWEERLEKLYSFMTGE